MLANTWYDKSVVNNSEDYNESPLLGYDSQSMLQLLLFQASVIERHFAKG
jgi:hypothetical protein